MTNSAPLFCNLPASTYADRPLQEKLRAIAITPLEEVLRTYRGLVSYARELHDGMIVFGLITRLGDEMKYALERGDSDLYAKLCECFRGLSQAANEVASIGVLGILGRLIENRALSVEELEQIRLIVSSFSDRDSAELKAQSLRMQARIFSEMYARALV